MINLVCGLSALFGWQKIVCNAVSENQFFTPCKKMNVF